MNALVIVGFFILGIIAALHINPVLGFFIACIGPAQCWDRKVLRTALYNTAGGLSFVGLLIAAQALAETLQGD